MKSVAKLLQKYDFRQILGISFFLISNFFWIVTFFPGNMSPDSLYSWHQLKTWQFNNGHPVIFTLLIWLLSFGGHFLALASIFEEFALSISLLLLIKLVSPNMRVENQYTWAGLINFTPFVGLMGVTIWKDIPSTYLTIYGIWFFVQYLKTKLTTNFFLAIGFLTLGNGMRHDGLSWFILFILGLVTLRLFYSPIRNLFKLKSLIWFSCFVVLITLFVNFLVPKLFHAEKIYPSQMYYPLVHDLAYANLIHPDLLPNDVSKDISLAVTGPAAQGAGKCERIDYMAQSAGYNAAFIDRHPSIIPVDWLKSFFSPALPTILKVHLCRAKAFLPGVPPSGYVWTYEAIDPNPYGIEHPHKLVKFFAFGCAWVELWNRTGKFIAWPALHALIIFLFGLFKARRHSANYFILILATAGLAKDLGNIIYTSGPYYRYGLLTQLVSLAFMVSLIDKMHYFWNHSSIKEK
jgi:hypothetical protein